MQVGDTVYYRDGISGAVQAEILSLLTFDTEEAVAEIQCWREPDGIWFTATVPASRLTPRRTEPLLSD